MFGEGIPEEVNYHTQTKIFHKIFAHFKKSLYF
jgi:hypothetical protein